MTYTREQDKEAMPCPQCFDKNEKKGQEKVN
jgi:hypothetical protein